ncbi:hypothetical protein [Wenjunlia tyrosinilytica]|nr:hypothetical protein [Wenjunlia tyrosinilytica]
MSHHQPQPPQQGFGPPPMYGGPQQPHPQPNPYQQPQPQGGGWGPQPPQAPPHQAPPQTPQFQPPGPPQPAPRRRTGLILGVLAGATALLVVAGIVGLPLLDDYLHGPVYRMRAAKEVRIDGKPFSLQKTTGKASKKYQAEGGLTPLNANYTPSGLDRPLYVVTGAYGDISDPAKAMKRQLKDGVRGRGFVPVDQARTFDPKSKNADAKDVRVSCNLYSAKEDLSQENASQFAICAWANNSTQGIVAYFPGTIELMPDIGDDLRQYADATIELRDQMQVAAD